jgi:hypothetical protein
VPHQHAVLDLGGFLVLIVGVPGMLGMKGNATGTLMGTAEFQHPLICLILQLPP